MDLASDGGLGAMSTLVTGGALDLAARALASFSWRNLSEMFSCMIKHVYIIS